MALGPLVLQVVGVYGPVPFLTGAALSLLVAVPLLPSLAHRAAHPGRSPRAASRPSWCWRRSPCSPPSPAAWASRSPSASCRSMPSAPACSAETGALWLSAFVMGNVVLQWPIGWLADHADRRAVLAGCTLASAAAGGRAAAGAGAVARRDRRGGAVGRHLLRDLSGRAGAARPALPRRRHRARQHRLQHDLHRRRPGRPADHRRGDGRVRRSRPRLDARLLLWRCATLAALLALRRPG